MPLTPAATADTRYHLHAYTQPRQLEREGPLVIVRGDGVHVIDEQGQRYLEGMAGLWCAALGFSEQRLVQAATRQMQTLPYYHTFSGKVPGPVTELAEALIRWAPVPMARVLFANSGSESNDTAVKLVRYYNNALGRPAKKKIIARVRGYHGVTLATASLSGLPMMHQHFDLPIDGVVRVGCPHAYQFAHDGESPEQFAARLAAELEQTILREGPDTVAAFIAEPVQGAGGVIVPPPGYFERIQPILKKHDILLIADASAAVGVFGHGYTYGGHPVACAVALEALKIYESDRIVEHVQRVAPRMQAGLRRYVGHPLVGDVRGLGLIGAIELAADPARRTPFDPARGVGAYLVRRAQAHGLIVRVMAGDIIAFSPPLVITEAQIDEMLDKFDRALRDTEAWVRSA